MPAHHETAHAPIAHQQVGTAPKPRDGNARLARETERGERLGGALDLRQHVRGAPDA